MGEVFALLLVVEVVAGAVVGLLVVGAMADIGEGNN